MHFQCALSSSINRRQRGDRGAFVASCGAKRDSELPTQNIGRHRIGAGLCYSVATARISALLKLDSYVPAEPDNCSSLQVTCNSIGARRECCSTRNTRRQRNVPHAGTQRLRRAKIRLAVTFRTPTWASGLARFTRSTGDDGTTGLGDGTPHCQGQCCASKPMAPWTKPTAPSAWCSQCRPFGAEVPCARASLDVQHDLFELGGELCIPGHTADRQSSIDRAARNAARQLQ